MKKSLIFVVITFFVFYGTTAQPNHTPTKVMTLGVFHFDYPNLDVVKTDVNDQISVLDEPFQSEIISICRAIEEFKPTLIAIESTPDNQLLIDSLYLQYKKGNYLLKKNELFQLGFRIAGLLDLDKVYCVDDAGKHYSNMEAIFHDNTRRSAFEHYYLNSEDTLYKKAIPHKKISSIVETLYESNLPETIKESLATYLLHPFKYEENPGDFTGVDFETGRWFNRNLRIFRNIQRIPHNSQDRILLIIGSGHLNLLNLFIDTSREFELVSPLPYLEKAKNG